MKFKEALLLNEELILEATPKKYLNEFIKGDYSINYAKKFNDRILKVDIINSRWGKSIPWGEEGAEIPVGFKTKQLEDFSSEVLNLAKEKELDNSQLLTLKNALKDFEEKVISKKK